MFLVTSIFVSDGMARVRRLAANYLGPKEGETNIEWTFK